MAFSLYTIWKDVRVNSVNDITHIIVTFNSIKGFYTVVGSVLVTLLKSCSNATKLISSRPTMAEKEKNIRSPKYFILFVSRPCLSYIF